MCNAPEVDLALGRQVTCPIVKSDMFSNVAGQDGQGVKQLTVERVLYS